MDVDLADPDAFAAGAPHEALSELRRTDQVHFQPMADEAGFWAVLRHADVVHVARNPATFSASLGGVVVEDLSPESLEMMRHMLLAMDPPTHTTHREPLSPHFRARVIGGLEDRVRTICRSIMDETAEAAAGGAVVEFIHEVTSGLPSRVVGELMGLPPEDWPTSTSWPSGTTVAKTRRPTAAAPSRWRCTPSSSLGSDAANRPART